MGISGLSDQMSHDAHHTKKKQELKTFRMTGVVGLIERGARGVRDEIILGQGFLLMVQPRRKEGEKSRQR